MTEVRVRKLHVRQDFRHLRFQVSEIAAVVVRRQGVP
jgi:hypothetical protein